MACLIEQIKEFTESKINAFRKNMEHAQSAIKAKADQDSKDNTDGIFELAMVVSDLQESIFELAEIVSELTEIGGEEEMVKLYLIAIGNGDMTIEDVPLLWRSRVQAELDRQEESAKQTADAADESNAQAELDRQEESMEQVVDGVGQNGEEEIKTQEAFDGQERNEEQTEDDGQENS